MNTLNEDLKIVNLVANLKTSSKINLEALQQNAQDGLICEIDFNPETFPGLVLKIPIGVSNISLTFFARRRKGKGEGSSVVISGSKNMEDLEAAATIARNLAETYKENGGDVPGEQ